MTQTEKQDEMARLVSDGPGLTPIEAGLLMGLSRNESLRVWRTICEGLGEQAV